MHTTKVYWEHESWEWVELKISFACWDSDWLNFLYNNMGNIVFPPQILLSNTIQLNTK